MTIFYFVTVLIFLCYLIYEYATLVHSLKSIPLRIMVNGSRGKSSMVYLVYSLLRKHDYKVFAKTTGNAPQIYAPDGNKTELKRWAPPTILENIRLLRRWAKQGAEAIVMECMALQPETQRILSRYIVKPHYLLVTNILTDHKEVMGRSLTDMTRSIAESFAGCGKIIIPESVSVRLDKAGIEFSQVETAETRTAPLSVKQVPDAVLAESWSVYSNLAGKLSPDKQISGDNFKQVWLSLAQNICYHLQSGNCMVYNLFSVNDTETAEKFIDHNIRTAEQEVQRIFIFNSRADRPLRTIDFIDLLSNKYPSVKIWLTGDGVLKRAQKQLNGRYEYVKQTEIIRRIKIGFPAPVQIFCLGNFKGMEKLQSYLQKTSKQQKVYSE